MIEELQGAASHGGALRSIQGGASLESQGEGRKKNQGKGRMMIEELQRQVAALQDEKQAQQEETYKKIETLKNEKRSLENLVKQKDKEIESLKIANEELQEQWKSGLFKQKKQDFMKKSQEPGWDMAQSSLEDIEYLFEEFEIQELLKPLNDLRVTSFDRLKGLSAGSAVTGLKIDHCKASKLVFSIELMGNGIYSKEDKEKHLQNCSICKLEVKKGLEEYGVAAKDSAAIAAKFAGMHFGEMKNLTQADCLNMGIEFGASFDLGEYFTIPKMIQLLTKKGNRNGIQGYEGHSFFCLNSLTKMFKTLILLHINKINHIV